jgi:hypothetical protein
MMIRPYSRALILLNSSIKPKFMKRQPLSIRYPIKNSQFDYLSPNKYYFSIGNNVNPNQNNKHKELNDTKNKSFEKIPNQSNESTQA